MHDKQLARYDRVTMLLHWVTGVGILLVGATELLREALFVKGHPVRALLGNLHAPAATVIFALILLRIIWRLTHKAPALPGDMTGLEALAAKATHLALYALMIAVPLVGIATQFARGRGIDFGIFQIAVPAGFPMAKDLAKALKEVHEVLGQGILMLAFVHAAAAVWHHRVRKDDVLVRMLPQRA